MPAISGAVAVYTSAVLVSELREVLAYPRLAKRLAAGGETVDQQVSHFMALAHLTAPAAIEGAVLGTGRCDRVGEYASAQSETLSGYAHHQCG